MGTGKLSRSTGIERLFFDVRVAFVPLVHAASGDRRREASPRTLEACPPKSERRTLPPGLSQQTLRRIEKAFVSMWEQNHGFPRFKKKGALRSFSFPQLSRYIAPLLALLVLSYPVPAP